VGSRCGAEVLELERSSTNFPKGSPRATLQTLDSTRLYPSGSCPPKGRGEATNATASPKTGRQTAGDDIVQGIVDGTMIGKAATYEDVGNVAVFAASNAARMMKASTLNISGGSISTKPRSRVFRTATNDGSHGGYSQDVPF
jgi:hypothetical protein